ncbi:hypothetical protein [Hoeflea alexandrii]|jgi:hypothetical protein|uniref:Uncharacterized protein n=2 Tax=Hoeflea alexandrii TaxID=288436 RepID=A0ABT1CUK9_9HYPH|nr:hypothetical protein [Hoeflea alexandrii]MCO6409894.1 hypothetical protein [Hoeflea alexandrii]
MFPSRKKFKFQVTPSDRELWAIGMVAMQWSLLEAWVSTLVQGLAQHDEDALARFNTTHSLEGRLETWKELTKEKMQEPYCSRMLRLHQRAVDTKQMRDRIIHGIWSSNDPVATTIQGGAPKHPFKWSPKFDKIKETAERIDNLMMDILQMLAELSPDKNEVNGRDALRQTLKQPNHPRSKNEG